MLQIQVEYFAILREHAGKKSEDIDTPATTASALFAGLEKRYGFPSMGHMKVAINDEFTDWDAQLVDGDTVVFIPPVAGG